MTKLEVPQPSESVHPFSTPRKFVANGAESVILTVGDRPFDDERGSLPTEGLAMRATSSVVRGGASRLAWLGLWGTLGIGVFGVWGASAETPSAGKPDSVALGRAIFEREWMPDDPRSHGGDGL